MTREEAIRIIKIVLAVVQDFEITVQGEELTEEKCKEAVEIATEAISCSDNPNRWIPVSERLPESSGVYIVTREFSDGFECADLTDACYFDGTSTWHNDNRINHGREYVDKKIKAWMPLPEPYETESEECDKEFCKSYRYGAKEKC